jgi:putative ABC transport system ATP-binding protein
MQSAVIECQGLKKHYGDGENRVDALRGVDLSIHDNQLTLLVGPSGSGKTTLMSIIAMILKADEGKLILLGNDTQTMSLEQKDTFRRDNIGIVFQSLFLIPTLTVLENVTLPLIIAGHCEKESNEKALTLLKFMEISHRANDSPYNMSKGQQQRVAIARAIINESKIIVCDEPTSALDHVHGMEGMGMLQELAKSRAVIVITHDHRIFSYADRIVSMDDGLIIMDQNS